MMSIVQSMNCLGRPFDSHRDDVYASHSPNVFSGEKDFDVCVACPVFVAS